MKTKISVILVIAILLIVYTALTNAHNDNTGKVFAQKQGTNTSLQQSSNTTKTITTMTKTQTLNVSKANGNFGSLQNDQTGKPAWLVVGPWRMNVSQGTMNVRNPNSNPSSAFFNSTLYMVKLDGTERHKHFISNFKLTSSSINKNMSATFNGTATITMKEGPVKDVPISIKFLSKNALSLWVDPTKTHNHFGNTPIYSIVWRTH